LNVDPVSLGGCPHPSGLDVLAHYLMKQCYTGFYREVYMYDIAKPFEFGSELVVDVLLKGGNFCVSSGVFGRC